MLDVMGLTVRLGGRTVVDGASFSVSEGQWLMIAGPNGAGKSTIINASASAIPYEGSVLLRGKEAKRYKARERARLAGLLPQISPSGYAFTAGEIICLGRYAHAPGFFSRQTDQGAGVAEAAIDLTGVRPLLKRSALTLSGGERQRVFLAQVLAQDPSLLLLDEPSNHLDMVYQKQLFSLLKEWLEKPGRAIVSAIHDLSFAMAFGTHALLLDKGAIKAQGPVGEVMTAGNLNEVYGMDVFEWMRGLMMHWVG